MNTLADINAIANALGKATESNGSYRCQCPAHDDNDPSLSISLSDDNKILVHCFAGCEQEAVIDKLKAQNLWHVSNGVRKVEGNISYSYYDIEGNKVFTKVRKPGKNFLIEPKANKNWYLYNLPGIRDAREDNQPIFLVEGEKDANNLIKLGLCATCNPHGASERWRDSYTESLHGCDVIVITDNDEIGKKHARKVCKALSTNVESVKLLELPGLQDKGDVSDWLEAGGTKEKLLELVDKLPEYEITYDGGLDLQQCSEIKIKPISWLWPERIARGKISLIAGHPGVGKSQLVIHMAAIVSTGGTWPVDDSECEAGKVVIISAEDDPADTLCPRLTAAGADLENLFVLKGTREDGSRNKTFNLETDIEELEKTLKRHKDIKLVIIDPVSAYLGETDSHHNADVRSLLVPLAEVATRYETAILLVSHLNKGEKSEAMTRVTGSMAFVAAARGAYMVTKDKQDSKRRLFLPIKNNIGNDISGFAFSVESSSIESEHGTIQTSYIQFEPNFVEISADDAMGNAKTLSCTEDAKQFLYEVLAHEPVSAKDLFDRAEQEGHAIPTIRRAKRQLGIKSVKNGSQWFWDLPTKASEIQDDQDDHVLPPCNLDHLDHLAG